MNDLKNYIEILCFFYLISTVIGEQVQVVYPFNLISWSNTTQVFKFEVLNIDHYFQPVDIEWQQKKCQNFKKRIVQTSSVLSNVSKELTVPIPKIKSTITEDRNSFYRALSFCIFGLEDHHLELREYIADAMFVIYDLSIFMKGAKTLKDYCSARNVNLKGTEAFYTEILTASYLLNTCIYIYSTEHKIWQFFYKNWPNYSLLNMKKKKCIYLTDTKNYIDVVTDVVDNNIINDVELLDTENINKYV
ncbi:uncharacterized protein LOC126904549 [Daktulosphaira vitifoliae]|uniref:uncharacterized protein LOC126904549 n=1 Tax=Daktulosphaira vitifoliae TaxID=58002 RepID=UPI0021AAB94E|nr:uncharacterized protein LOC126904549 [Daktulosphaira vitifoliae]